jgi:beta-phosphoglucomutase-like phosphatase (HAD superfamily)
VQNDPLPNDRIFPHALRPVQAVDAILFEPVGTLAEFPAAPFQNAAARGFARSKPTQAGGGGDGSVGGSQAYWDLVDLLASCERPLQPEQQMMIEAAELEAVDGAIVYDDAGPALGELAGLGVRLIVASSLSEAALSRFIDGEAFRTLFQARWSRDSAGDVGEALLRLAVTSGSLAPDRVLFLADTESGIRAATRAGVRAILMMNDPDEAMRLTACEPAGGIVSLHELPDMVRLVAARHPR